MPPRSSFLFAPLTAAILALGWSSFQEPKPPAVAPDAAKPIPGVPPKHTLEGVYELRRRVVGGRPEARPSRGYMAITTRHMFLCLAGPGPEDDQPLLRAGVRTWVQKDELIESVVKIGYFTDAEGGIHVESPATAEKRRISLERGILRIHQDAANHLEFERIE